MRDLGSELERRAHLRARPQARCEAFLEGERHEAVVLDLSHGGLLLACDAPAQPGALLRLRLADRDRWAVVLRERHVPHRLRSLLPRAFGLRWLSAHPAD